MAIQMAPLRASVYPSPPQERTLNHLQTLGTMTTLLLAKTLNPNDVHPGGQAKMASEDRQRGSGNESSNGKRSI